MGDSSSIYVAAAILGITYLGIAFPRFFRLKIDRSFIALLGAFLIVLLGVVPFSTAASLVDYKPWHCSWE